MWLAQTSHHIIIFDTVCVIPFPSFLILVPISEERSCGVNPWNTFPIVWAGLGWLDPCNITTSGAGRGDTHSMLCQRVAQTTLSLTSAILADKLSPLLLKS